MMQEEHKSHVTNSLIMQPGMGIFPSGTGVIGVNKRSHLISNVVTRQNILSDSVDQSRLDNSHLGDYKPSSNI